MTDSNLAARIGTGYYQQIGDGKEVGNDKVWTIKIDDDASIIDTNHRGKYALIKHSGGDTYITYGTKDEITGAINNSTQPQQLKTRYFDADSPSSTKVNNGAGEKSAPTKDNVVKAWAFANSSDPTVKQTWDYYANQITTDAGSSEESPPATDSSSSPTTGTKPSATSSDLGEIDTDDANAKASIEFKTDIQLVDPAKKLQVKVNGADKEINAADVSVNGKNLEIKASALKSLGLNPGVDNSIEVKAGQVADKNDNSVTNDAVTVTVKPKAASGGTPEPKLVTATTGDFNPNDMDIEFDKNIDIDLTTGFAIYKLTPDGTRERSNIRGDFTVRVENNKIIIEDPNGKFESGKMYEFLILGNELSDGNGNFDGDGETLKLTAKTPTRSGL